MKIGDLVLYKNYKKRSKNSVFLSEFALVLDVHKNLTNQEEEALISFPSDGFQGWFLSKHLTLISSESGELGFCNSSF